MIRALVTDLDNTLYSWHDYIVPSLEAMVASLERTTHLPRIRIVQALKKVYAEKGTNEYAFAIQESELFSDFAWDFGSFQKLVIEPAKEAFSAARRRYLKLYPEVRHTLEQVRARGLKVVALTDAPRNPAEARLRFLGLEKLLDGVYSLSGYPLPDFVDEKIRHREAQGGYRSQVRWVELPADHEKPDPRGLRRALDDLGVRPDEALVVGDNLRKDVAVALEVGARAAWAEYGTYISAEYRERLAIISAPSVTKRHVAEDLHGKGVELPPGVRALSSFRQVTELLDALATPSGRTAEAPVAQAAGGARRPAAGSKKRAAKKRVAG